MCCDLVGDQKDAAVKLNELEIEHKTEITFEDIKSKNSKYKPGAYIHKKVKSFLGNRGFGTDKAGTFPDDKLNHAKQYARKGKYPISPLRVKIDGLKVDIDTSTGDHFEPVLEDAIILPGIPQTAQEGQGHL